MPDRPRIGIWLTRTDPYWVQVNEAIHSRRQQLPVDLIPLEAVLAVCAATWDRYTRAASIWCG